MTACDCSCHDCCIPLWAACQECDDNHPQNHAALGQVERDKEPQ